MSKPPARIDGAEVLWWAWSGDTPFGFIRCEPGELPPTAIYGLAICAYDASGVYRFSCDREWESQNDAEYDSVERARQAIPEQYKNATIVWQRYSDTAVTRPPGGGQHE